MSKPHISRSQRVSAALLLSPLYFILDESLCRQMHPLQVAREALAGGVKMLQLRFKTMEASDLLSLTRQLLVSCHSADALLLVNDRADIAIEAGADGVHLGEHDEPVGHIRALAPELIIGATARTAQAAQNAEADGADYIGSGSVFSSATKGGLPLIGPEGLMQVVEAVAIPVTAIGGITLSNCLDVMRAGAAGFSAIAPFRETSSVRELAMKFNIVANGHTS
jgi:thiamine-phosphate diphosphorylase